MGDLFIAVGHEGKPTNYKRELDLDLAEGRVSYDIDGEKYKRTYFGSYPLKSMVYHFESSKKTDYEVQYDSPHKKINEEYSDGIYSFQGEVKDNGMQFETCLKIDSDGQMDFNNGKIHVSGAKTCTIYQVAATDYVMKYPEYKGADYMANNKKTLFDLSGKSYEQIRKEHQKDYQGAYLAGFN